MSLKWCMLHGVYRGISASEVSVARAASMAAGFVGIQMCQSDIGQVRCVTQVLRSFVVWLQLTWGAGTTVLFIFLDWFCWVRLGYIWNYEMTLWVLAGFLGDLGIDFFLLVIPSLTNADIVLIVASILAFPAEKWWWCDLNSPDKDLKIQYYGFEI